MKRVALAVLVSIIGCVAPVGQVDDGRGLIGSWSSAENLHVFFKCSTTLTFNTDGTTLKQLSCSSLDGTNADVYLETGTYSASMGVVDIEYTESSCPNDSKNDGIAAHYMFSGESLTISSGAVTTVLARTPQNDKALHTNVTFGCFDTGNFVPHAVSQLH